MLNLLFILILLSAFFVSFAYFLNWYYRSSSKQDATYFTTTADGWKLAIHHYRPENPNGSIPVILCHGLSANRFIFDMEQAPSLACYLRDNGYDVWVPELRGSGMSDSPGLFSSCCSYTWGYEDHLKYDIPAIIGFVTKESLSDKVKWVGHSMGGMLIYSHIARQKDSRITSVTTIGAPVDFNKMADNVFEGLVKLKFLLKLFPVNPLPFLGRLLVPVISEKISFVHGLYFKTNIKPYVARSLSAVGSELISPSMLWLDMANFFETGQFLAPDGISVLKKIQDSEIPIYVIAGSKDAVAPVDSVIKATESNVSSGVRRLLVAGLDAGFEQEYGHIDLALGLRAHREIYPRIHSWLQQF